MRKAIPKKLRFEIFKRDSFTCQYCGRKAPDVLLECDHIEPVAAGGRNSIFNLITSCEDCNSGKSDRKLSDATVLGKQREQLAGLQQRKEQLRMMFEWQKSLGDLESDALSMLAGYWADLVRDYHLNEHGLKTLKGLQKRYPVDKIMEAMRTSVSTHCEETDGKFSNASVGVSFKKLSGILHFQNLEKSCPQIRRYLYIRGILRNRVANVVEWQAMELIRESHERAGLELDALEEFTKKVTSWTAWRTGLEAFIQESAEKRKEATRQKT